MKLIVIGNGYDLNLKLKSSFGDFYSSFYKKADNSFDCNKIRNNIWALLLYFKYINEYSTGFINFNGDSPDWMNVEETICNVLNNTNIISIIDRAIRDGTKRYQPKGQIQCSNYQEQHYELTSLVQMKKSDFGLDSPYQLLFEDLRQFESDFMKYLGNTIMPEYAIKSDSLMSKMTSDYSHTYVISFNYTKLPPGLAGTNQVHGSLDEENIIIGVDRASIVDGNINKMRFSKSWRQLSDIINNSMLPPKKDINEIVFFGHSLGPQDYSYFHSIFNYYDIYSNNIKLTFLYANFHYDPKTQLPDILKDDEHRISYIDSVYNLLNNYMEKSLGRKEADSFVTKIQLEGRLRVQEINEYWIKNVKQVHGGQTYSDDGVI